jgi:hypothetical protein
VRAFSEAADCAAVERNRPEASALRTNKSKSFAVFVAGSKNGTSPPAKKLSCDTIAMASPRIAPDVRSSVPEISTIEVLVRLLRPSPYSDSVCSFTFTVNWRPCGPCIMNEAAPTLVTPATKWSMYASESLGRNRFETHRQIHYAGKLSVRIHLNRMPQVAVMTVRWRALDG